MILSDKNPEITFRKWFKYFLDIFIHRYIYLGLCTAGLTYFTYFSLALPIDILYVASILSGTFLIYNYHSFFSLSPKMLIDQLIKSPLIILYLISTVFLLVLSISVTYVWILLLALVIVMGYYSVGVFKNYTFRKSWIKPLSIGIVYALITLTYPAATAHLPWLLILSLTLERIVFIAALALIFDVGDVEKDRLEVHPTVPTLLGVRTSIVIAILWVVLACIVNIYAFSEHWVKQINFYALLVTYLVAVILFISASPLHRKSFYLVYVDGMIGLPFIIFLFAQWMQWILFEIIFHI